MAAGWPCLRHAVPTYGNHNTVRQGRFPEFSFNATRREPYAYGDIVSEAKSNSLNYQSLTSPFLSQNIRFLFLGDPLMRFPLPQGNIAVTKINGMSIGASDDIVLHAMSMVSLEGEVRNANGHLDAGFNGTLWVRFYDQKAKIKVKFNGDTTRNVYYHKDVLYQGQVSVTAGRFNISFQVPKDIMPGMGRPRFSFYAYDSIRDVDAMGKFDGLTWVESIPRPWWPTTKGPRSFLLEYARL